MVCYKIAVNVPAGTERGFMDSLEEAMGALYPGYGRCFSYWDVKGTWRAAEGSHPYSGEIGKVEVADEVRVEFAVREEDLEAVVRRIEEVHPYEEPVVDVIPMVAWRDALDGRISRRGTSASCAP